MSPWLEGSGLCSGRTNDHWDGRRAKSATSAFRRCLLGQLLYGCVFCATWHDYSPQCKPHTWPCCHCPSVLVHFQHAVIKYHAQKRKQLLARFTNYLPLSYYGRSLVYTVNVERLFPQVFSADHTQPNRRFVGDWLCTARQRTSLCLVWRNAAFLFSNLLISVAVPIFLQSESTALFRIC